MTVQDFLFSDEKWLDFWRNFKGKPQQVKGVLKLGQRVRQLDPRLLADSAEWVADYREKQQPQTWDAICRLAVQAGAKYPELVAAQWALESDWGKSFSGKNNPFGLKGRGTQKQTTEVIEGREVVIKAEFMDFDSVQDAVIYLVDRWYKDFRQFRGVNRAASRSEAARLLSQEGYATDPQYAKKLIGLMDQHAPLSSALPTPAGGLDPRGSEEAGMTGPAIKAPVKPGDSYLLVNDRDEDMEAYDHTGKLLWRIPCLARGQGADNEWRKRNTDTPPGLYRVGKIYKDYEQNPNPPRSDTAMSYGWYSFDMEEMEGQESRNGRAGIMLHGGGTACGWPGAWAPRQALHPTLGCLRIQNIDLRDKVLPLTKKGTVFIGVFQER